VQGNVPISLKNPAHNPLWCLGAAILLTHQNDDPEKREVAMKTAQGLIMGALGCFAIGISAGQAAAEAPTQAYIAGQLMPKILVANRGLPVGGVAAQQPTPPTVGIAVRVSPAKAPRETATAVNMSRLAAPAVRPVAVRTPAAPSVPLNTIEFEFGSDRLKPESIETLKNLGGALNEELKDQKLFRIEGHTDASGSRTYNAVLSDRRAEAVKDYLVQEMHVSPDRLEAVGKGSSQPVVPKNPYAAQNRRVVVINLGA
jgi:OOP family OmpA-OmpF porin